MPVRLLRDRSVDPISTIQRGALNRHEVSRRPVEVCETWPRAVDCNEYFVVEFAGPNGKIQVTVMSYLNLVGLLGGINSFFDLYTGGPKRPVLFDAKQIRPELCELDRHSAEIPVCIASRS